MYGLPQDFDPQCLLERTLELICFSTNQVFLHFDKENSITIEGKYSIQNDRYFQGAIVHAPQVAPGLMDLVGKSISRAAAEDKRTLLLVFQDKTALRCYDDSDNFESFRISSGGREIIV